MIENVLKRFVLRLTNGNCSPPVRRFGFHKTPFGLRPLRRFVPAQFANPAKPSVSLIRVAKTSVTCNVIYITDKSIYEGRYKSQIELGLKYPTSETLSSIVNTLFHDEGASTEHLQILTRFKHDVLESIEAIYAAYDK
jgi:hypothetical protein